MLVSLLPFRASKRRFLRHYVRDRAFPARVSQHE